MEIMPFLKILLVEDSPADSRLLWEMLRDSGIKSRFSLDPAVTLKDALSQLSSRKFDLVLLDGWKDLYLPMLALLRPKLRRGSVVCADNIFTFKKDLAPYVAHVNDPANGFRSMTLPLGSGLEYSVCVG